MKLDDLLNILSNDIAKTGIDANSPGEMVRSSLAGQMPGMSPRLPMSLAGAPVAPVARSPIAPASPPSNLGGPVAAAHAAPAAPSPVRMNPLGTMARGYQSGGIFGAISNIMDEPALLERQAQEKARADALAREQANQTVQALVAAGAPPQIAQATIGNPELAKRAIETYIRPAADPLDRQKRELEIEKLRREVSGQGGSADDKTPQGRASLAKQLGLQEGTDAYNSYVMTGRLPREDQQRLTVTDKKAILEADEAVNATEGAMNSLRRAMELSKTAYDGALAGERGWLTSQFGSTAGNDTRELNQVVTEGALQQLKAIFGGMPTEGERKILLEIQGSAEMPQEVRDRIYKRALELAEKRLKFNKARADELRGGTFYQSEPPKLEEPQSAVEVGQPVDVGDGFKLRVK